MIYVIDKYEICPATGFIDVTAYYQINSSLRKEVHHYKSDEDAYHNICFQMKHVVYDRYRSFLKNSKSLYDCGDGVYQSILKTEAFTYLFNTLNSLWDRDLQVMCRNIVALREKLHKILPGARHPNYEYLHSEVIEIVAFAKVYKDFNIESLKQREITKT